MVPMKASFRPATEDDLERLVEIHLGAFPDPRSNEARLRNFARNPLGTLSDLWVLVEGGVLVAHAFLFPLEAWFGGRRVAVGGIATVGVAPEARSSARTFSKSATNSSCADLCRTRSG